MAARGPHARQVAHQQAELRLLPWPNRCARATQRVRQKVVGCPRHNVGARHGRCCGCCCCCRSIAGCPGQQLGEAPVGQQLGEVVWGAQRDQRHHLAHVCSSKAGAQQLAQLGSVAYLPAAAMPCAASLHSQDTTKQRATPCTPRQRLSPKLGSAASRRSASRATTPPML